MKRIISVLLCAALLAGLGVLTSCSSKDNEITGGSKETTGAEPATEAQTEAPQTPDFPEGTDFNGQTVRILFDKAQMNRTYTEETNGEIVNDAIYDRLRSVEETLDVTLSFISLEGAWAKRAEFAETVASAVQSGSGEFDLVAAYNLTPPTMAARGLLVNLYDLDYPEFDRVWWPQNLLSQSLLEDKLFFCADNSSWQTIRNMDVIVYNTRLAEDNNLGDPTEWVLDGTWTMDKLESVVKGLYRDLNGDGTVGVDEDQFGLATDTSARMDGYFYAAGLTITKFDENDLPMMNLNNEEVVNFLERMCRLYNDNPDVRIDSKQYKMFKEERAVFYETAIAIADQRLEFDYGVLPLPKFDENQEGYITGMSNTHDVWCIPKGTDTAGMAGMVLEDLAYEAYEKVAPAYFEVALKLKYSSNSNAGRVYDLIRAGMTFDFGYIYGNNFTTVPFITVRNCILNNDTDWASKVASYQEQWNTDLAAIVDSLRSN